MYCFDTDTLSAVLKRDPPLDLIRKLAAVPPEDQFTTAINLGELMYGAAKARRGDLVERIREIITTRVAVLPFDEHAAEYYGPLRAELESKGRALHEADLRIASIALVADLVVVTGNVRHFKRVPELKVENWLEP